MTNFDDYMEEHQAEKAAREADEPGRG